jgi:hypothetical protein
MDRNMMNRNELCLRLTRGVAALLACALAAGQDGPGTGVEFARKFGVQEVNGQLRLYAKAGVKTMGEADADFREQQKGESGKKLEAAAGAALDVEFLGKLREALALQVKYELPLARAQGRERANAVASAREATNRKIPGEIKKEVRLCGFTIELQDDGCRSDKSGPKNLVPGGVTAQFMVGPVPLLVRANAGVGMDIGLAPFSACEDGAVGLEAAAGAYCNGWVVAGVGAGCRFASVCAGVKADLRLVDFVKTVRLGVDADTIQPLLKLSYKLTPAAIKLSLIAYAELRVGFAKISKKFEHLVWQWSAPAIAAELQPVGS